MPVSLVKKLTCGFHLSELPKEQTKHVNIAGNLKPKTAWLTKMYFSIFYPIEIKGNVSICCNVLLPHLRLLRTINDKGH